MGRNGVTVPENGTGVAQFKNLVQAMRHIDQDFTLPAQIFNQSKQDLRFMVRKTASRFIESNDLSFPDEGLANLHHLSFSDG
jgi:hypothetical protein